MSQPAGEAWGPLPRGAARGHSGGAALSRTKRVTTAGGGDPGVLRLRPARVSRFPDVRILRRGWQKAPETCGGRVGRGTCPWS